ncbi:coth protein-domain-containing protein [Sporodiniella umbellata]|nr:coth protein-domain-containing protein [Sporodiniella umbellata]
MSVICLISIVLGILTVSQAVTVTFNVICPGSSNAQVSIGGSLHNLNAVSPQVPLYTGSVEVGSATSYSYHCDSKTENFSRTLASGVTNTLNDFFDRPLTYANIPPLPRPLDNGRQWPRADENPSLFDTNYIPTIIVNGNPIDMETLVTTVPKAKFMVELTMIGKDYYKTFQNVQFSITGAGKKNNPAKQSWRWTFAEGDSINNRNNFKIRHMEEDPTQMREKLYADCLRAMGTYANQANMVRLFINGEGFGTFNMLDDIPKYSYINANFYAGKPPPQMGPLYNGASGAGFQLLSPGEYTMFKPNKQSPEGPDAVMSLAQAFHDLDLTNDDAIYKFDQSVFDVDQFLRFMVMEYLAGHWDGYWQEQTNDGAYKDPLNNKWYYLGQDYDATFGVNLPEEVLELSYKQYPEKFPGGLFINGLLKNQKVHDLFQTYIADTVKVLFNNNTIAEHTIAYHQFIDPDLQWDRSIKQRSPGPSYGWTAPQTLENLSRGVVAPSNNGGGAAFGLNEWVYKKSQYVAKDLGFVV